MTSGVERWGFGYLDTFFRDCKAQNIRPLCFFWTWGDAIGPTVFSTGVADKYQKTEAGKAIWVTTEKCVAWATEIAKRAKAAGVDPIVVIEHEGTKNGVDKSPAGFVAYWNRIHDTLKTIHPPTSTVFCSAIWNDQALIARGFASCITKADYIGLQTLLFAPRHRPEEFRGAGTRLAAAFQAIRAAAPGKPAAVIDLGFSSYGGTYATTPPFSGGSGSANDALQAEAIASVGKALSDANVAFICYRALRDDPNFNVANFGGYAERHVGIVRGDGTKKPAYDALMQIAKPVAPRTYSEAEYQAVRAELAAAQAKVETAVAGEAKAQAEVVRLGAILDTIRKAGGW